jgi:hypothetical protein
MFVGLNVFKCDLLSLFFFYFGFIAEISFLYSNTSLDCEEYKYKSNHKGASNAGGSRGCITSSKSLNQIVDGKQ